MQDEQSQHVPWGLGWITPSPGPKPAGTSPLTSRERGVLGEKPVLTQHFAHLGPLCEGLGSRGCRGQNGLSLSCAEASSSHTRLVIRVGTRGRQVQRHFPIL